MKEELRKRAIIGDESILDDYLEEALEEELDKFGWNAYHFLAQGRKTRIVKFNGAYKLRNKSGKTAIDILLESCEITTKVLAKFFPWYEPDEGEEIEESIKKIRETSAAEKFILSIT